MSVLKTKIEATGKLEIWSQEGGYAAPCVSIGKEDLTTWIEDELKEHAEENEYNKTFGEIGRLKGIWKITVERIDL